MADQTISVNFVAKNNDFLNPMAQMTKATKTFTDTGNIAKDVFKALGFAALATGLAFLTPREEFGKLVNVIKVGSVQMVGYVSTAAAFMKKELGGVITSSVASSMAGSMEDFAKRAALGIASLGFLDKAAIGLGLSIVGGLTVAAKAAADFDQSMRQVNTVLQYSGSQYDQLNKGILDISANFPIAAKDIADGVYKIASAGFTSLNDVLMLTKASATDAVAGLSDMSTSAKTLVTVLNAYGLAATDAAHVSDVLFQAVKDGQINFTELSQQLAGFVGLAKNSGTSLEETMATYALITNQMGDGAEAATSLAGVLRAIISPTNDAAKVLRIMGFESGQAAIEHLGLIGTIKGMNAAVNGETGSLAQLFPNIRALNGVLAITGTSNAKAASTLSDFTDKTKVSGAAQKAYQEQMKNVNEKLDQLKNASATVAIEIGRTFLPIMGQLVQFMGGFLGMLKDAPDWVKSAIGIFAGLAATLLTVGGTVLALRSSWNILKTVMKAADFLGISGSVKQLTSELDILSTAATTAKAALGTLAIVATAVFIAFEGVQEIDKFYQSMEKIPQKTKEVVGSLLDLANGATTVQDTLKGSNFDTEGFVKKMFDFGAGASGFTNSMNNIDKGLAALVKSGDAEKASEAIQSLSESIEVQQKLGVSGPNAQADAYAKLLGMFGDYKKAIGDKQVQDKLSANSDSSLADGLNNLQTQYGGAAAGAVALGTSEAYVQSRTDALNESQKALQGTLQGLNLFSNTSAIDAVSTAHQSAADASGKASKAAAQAAQTPSQVIGNQLSLARAIQSVATAQTALTAARQKDFSLDLRSAERAVAASYDDTKRAIFALQDATQALNDLRNPSARTVDEANIALQRSLIAQQQSVADLATAQDKLNLARDHANPDEIAQAQRELAQAQYAVTESGYAVVDAQKKYDDLTKDTPDRQKAIAQAQLDVNDATRNVADSTDGQTKAMQALKGVQDDIKDQPKVIQDAELALKEALNGVTGATEAMQQQQSGPDATAATSTFNKNIDLQNTSLAELSKALEQSITDSHNFWDNTLTVAQKYGPQVVNEIDKMGTAAPSIMAKMATASNTEGQRFANDLITNAASGTKSFNQIMQDVMSQQPGTVHTYTKAAMDALASELGIGVEAAGKILDGYGLQLEKSAGVYLVETSPGNFRSYDPLTGAAPGAGVGTHASQDAAER